MAEVGVKRDARSQAVDAIERNIGAPGVAAGRMIAWALLDVAEAIRENTAARAPSVRDIPLGGGPGSGGGPRDA